MNLEKLIIEDLTFELGERFSTFGKVVINKYVNVGSNTVIMPNLSIGEGSVVGALSFVNKSLKPWGIYFGTPVKRIGERKRNVIELSKKIDNEKK